MILLDRITKTYPGDEEPALDNVSLHIEPHEFVFLVGKSGAGKSTLIKMITKKNNLTLAKSSSAESILITLKNAIFRTTDDASESYSKITSCYPRERFLKMLPSRSKSPA